MSGARASIVPPNWSVPDAARRRLSPTTYGRQRAIAEDGHLLLVLHRPPGPNETSREGQLFWRSPEGEWLLNRGGPGPAGLRRLIGEYVDLESKLSETFDKDPDTKTLFVLLEALTPAARAARNLEAAIQAARESVSDDPFLLEMRDTATDVARNYELLLEDVRNAIAYRNLREAEEQARLTRETVRAGHRLNLIAALFLPLTAITSVFGMNAASGLAESPSTFWLALVAGLAMGGVTVAWVLAKPRM